MLAGGVSCGAVANTSRVTCCRAAPPILEFDPEGNLVNSWGGPGEGYTWPVSNHGITLDNKDNVWIGGNGNTDTHILKFDKTGKNIAKPMVLFQVQGGEYKVVAPTKWASSEMIYPRPMWSER